LAWACIREVGGEFEGAKESEALEVPNGPLGFECNKKNDEHRCGKFVFLNLSPVSKATIVSLAFDPVVIARKHARTQRTLRPFQMLV
jgi:hypothetical protein